MLQPLLPVRANEKKIKEPNVGGMPTSASEELGTFKWIFLFLNHCKKATIIVNAP
jgi:hypothetical protein